MKYLAILNSKAIDKEEVGKVPSFDKVSKVVVIFGWDDELVALWKFKNYILLIVLYIS